MLMVETCKRLFCRYIVLAAANADDATMVMMMMMMT